ncbi:hypothetical protein JCM17844_21000 [Iodidimonas gelatinilytica]|uniref:Uncharacterized protein n=1 Tax=Iodidimonas gelatinilytica TaxID=1236966 RepID=A0A5A7MT78_9PROT|nr:hypothetical protein JCM17844_21000 [Iodidimonas gelatinilytica]
MGAAEGAAGVGGEATDGTFGAVMEGAEDSGAGIGAVMACVCAF